MFQVPMVVIISTVQLGVCQFDGDSGVDKLDISVGLSLGELFSPSTPIVGFQMVLLLMLVIWVLVLQELLVHSRDSTWFYLHDLGGL